MEFLIKRAIDMMPGYIAYMIKKRLSEIKGAEASLEELRLIRGRGSCVFIGGRCYRLNLLIGGEELYEILNRACQGAIYRYKDTIVKGYIPLGDGIRVGISGGIRYDKDTPILVEDINALIYRFPGAESSLHEELYTAYKNTSRGMLIYAGGGGGKTTAIRTLSKEIAKRKRWERVVVIDEREEFDCKRCCDLGIVVLRGYRRQHGMDIALRTLSASVIIVDEVGCEDESYLIRQFLLSGAKFIATAHASSLDDTLRRDSLLPYHERQIFDTFFGIFNTDGNYYCKVDKI